MNDFTFSEIPSLNSLFLLQASPSTQVNEAQVTLTNPTPEKVPSSYKQLIRVNGEKVILQTANYQTKSGLLFYCNRNEMKALAVPVDDWLREQLTNIEKAVMTKVTIPPDVPKSKEGAYVYRPLILRDTLFLSVSKWCRYFKFDSSKGGYTVLENFVPFEKGQYNVNIEVSHVYIGPHKGGQNFSLSLRITQIMYKEEEKSSEFHLDDEILARVLDSTPTDTAPPPTKKKAEKRNKKPKTESASKVSKTV